MELKDELLQYIRDNKGWTDAMEEVALEQINKMRCPLRMTATGENICNNIRELLESFAEENDLDTDWWSEDFDDEEEIFWAL